MIRIGARGILRLPIVVDLNTPLLFCARGRFTVTSIHWYSIVTKSIDIPFSTITT